MSEPATRQPVRRLAARLAHDVGKYVARTARNAGEAEWTKELAAMLCRDLYALPGGRASALLALRAEPIEAALGPQAELADARDLLEQIDALENAVRRGEPPALARAARLALDVERVLRELARRLSDDTP